MDIWALVLMLTASICAGVINALAGGGTLITFPALTFLGVPAIHANITNTVALCPGYFGGTWAQRKDLSGQSIRIRLLVPVALAGGITGGLLLTYTGEKLFREMVPWLILLASLLLALQPLVKKWLQQESAEQEKSIKGSLRAALLGFPATVYGGYFGAGLGVILLAFLGMALKDTLTRINALKQLLSLVTNLSAAVFFLFSGKVDWTYAGLMAAGALLGGFLGGKLARRIKPAVLRWVVVFIGLTVAILFFIEL